MAASRGLTGDDRTVIDDTAIAYDGAGFDRGRGPNVTTASQDGAWRDIGLRMVDADGFDPGFVAAFNYLQPLAAIRDGRELPREQSIRQGDERQFYRGDYAVTLDSVRSGLWVEQFKTLDYTCLFDRPSGPGVGTFHDWVHFLRTATNSRRMLCSTMRHRLVTRTRCKARARKAVGMAGYF